jgi:outer membrane protein OmpA-like peptidoglycan-associated protein
MKKTLLLLATTVFFIQNTYSQNITEALAAVKQYVKDIKLEKETVSQKLESAPDDPLEMTLTNSITNAKGQSTTDSYRFNFAFFDLSSIKRDASKKQLAMELKTTEGLKAIGVTKNGKADKYTNELVILCDNADDARDLEKALKDVVTQAKKAWEASTKIPTDYPGLWRYIETNVQPFTAQGIDAQVKAKQNTTLDDRLDVEYTKTEGKKTEEYLYSVSVGDLLESGLKIDVSGNEVAFVASTANKAAFVSETKNKKMEYSTELRILMASPSQAKKMQLAFMKLIPLARKQLQNRLPKNTNGSFDGLQQITSFSTNNSQYDQTISADCLCSYTSNQIEKGKTKGQSYLFNFSDLTDFKLDIDNDLAKVTATTLEKLEFVAKTEKNERKFERNIEFIFADVEKARYFLAHMSSLSAKCKENLKPETFDWLVNKLKNAGVNNISQSLSIQEGGNRAKWRFAVTETGAKKSNETVYEFNCFDLDMTKLDFTAKDQNLLLKIPTKKKEKLIKQTTDGKNTFTGETSFTLTNAEDAKKINVTIREIVQKYALLTEGKFVTNAIVFDVNSANIQAQSNETLKTVGEILEDNTNMKIKIIGHTDSDGDDNKNLQLSQKRAAAVKDYLLKNHKIDPSRISNEGKGEKAPAMPNTTPEGKAANRRVEFVKI